MKIFPIWYIIIYIIFGGGSRPQKEQKMEDNVKPAVAVVKCERYSDCFDYVKKTVDMLGGIGKFVRAGDRVVIKPNLVSRKNPDEAATTHPAVVKAVCELVKAAGGEAVIAESPGGAYNAAVLRSVYSGCGMDKAAEEGGAKLNYDTSFSETPIPDGKTVKSLAVIEPILKADVVISVAKLKTHAMTSYTGAVKNLFGAVPGTHKAELHFRLNEREAFCSMLLDLCGFIKPSLSIIDGVWGMEGNGPTAGKNRHMGLIMASENPYALDLTASRVIGYTPEEVPTVRQSLERGLTVRVPEILGGSIDSFIVPDVEKPESHFNLLKILPLPSALNAAVTNMFSARPEIDKSVCVGCGECMRCCPPRAIKMKNKRPEIDKGRCIKCFCCQELCPKRAVKIKRPLANRLMLKILK